METDIVAVEVDIVVVYDEDVARLAYEFTIDYDDIAVVSVDGGDDQWPVAVFAGPEDQIAGMLMDRGYEDGIETYAI